MDYSVCLLVSVFYVLVLLCFYVSITSALSVVGSSCICLVLKLGVEAGQVTCNERGDGGVFEWRRFG